VRRNERGAVLLLVLAAVALLAMLAVDLAARASADSLRSSRSSRDAAFRRVFDSGSEVARGILAERVPRPFDSWGQPWNQAIRFALGPQEAAALRMMDESGKLNISRAISNPDEAMMLRGRLGRLFDYLARHDSSQNRAWKELGAKVQSRVASRQTLLTLDGLKEAGLDQGEVFGPEGLSKYLTCFGDGRINLNTAPRAVLYAVDPELDDAMVDRIAGFRGKGDGEPGTYKAFQEPQDLMLVEGIVNRSVGADGQMRVDRNLYEKLKGLITVKSSCFSVRVLGKVDAKEREAWAFFQPSGSRLALEELLP
jgi:type II secretory pathway component PulK